LDPLVPPGIGPQMVAPENELVATQAHLPGQRLHERHEILWLHAGVPAVLVDLIGRGLDEGWGAVFHRLFHGGPQGQGVGRADGPGGSPGKDRLDGNVGPPGRPRTWEMDAPVSQRADGPAFRPGLSEVPLGWGGRTARPPAAARSPPWSRGPPGRTPG